MVVKLPADRELTIAAVLVAPVTVDNPMGWPLMVKSPTTEASLITIDMLVSPPTMSSFGLNAAAITAAVALAVPANPGEVVSNTRVSPLTGVSCSSQFAESLQVPSTASDAPVQCRVVGVARMSVSVTAYWE